MNGTISRKVLVILAVLGICVASRGAEQYDAIKNGSFEINNSSGKIASWHASDWSRNHYRVMLTADKEHKTSGHQSAKIQTDGVKPNLAIWQDVNIEGDTQCKLDLMAWATEKVKVKVELICFDSSGKGKKIINRVTSDTLISSDKWMPLSVSLKPPSRTEMIRVILRSTGIARFDEVVFNVNGTRLEPNNAAQLKRKKAVNGYIDAKADAKRKALMSPEELAWEKTLEDNLGPFYLPAYKRCKKQGRVTAWDYVKDDPKLPRVLIIGDSISRGYTVPTRQRLKGRVNLHRAPANCGSTGTALKKLDIWLGNAQWDLIYFNFGIHNRKSDPKIYARDLERIIARLKKTKAKLVWAQSTPLNGQKFKEGVMVKLNSVARHVMKKHNIPISDLYSAARKIQEKCQLAGGCHFTLQGYNYLSKVVANDILKNLQ